MVRSRHRDAADAHTARSGHRFGDSCKPVKMHLKLSARTEALRIGTVCAFSAHPVLSSDQSVWIQTAQVVFLVKVKRNRRKV